METINITVKLPAHKVVEFQQDLDSRIQVVHFKILPNTEQMYEADETYQELCKLEKKAKTVKSKYINDNNNKYK